LGAGSAAFNVSAAAESAAAESELPLVDDLQEKNKATPAINEAPKRIFTFFIGCL
jgi:hypothetical protein